MSSKTVDLAVVGAGPCGLAVGAAATGADLRAVVFDRGPLCSALVAYPPYMTFFSTSERLEIGGIPFPTSHPNPTRLEALSYYRGVARYFELDIRQYQDVERVERTGGSFLLHTRHFRGGDPEIWEAGAVVVATGGFDEPNYLGVPGEELPKVSHHYREAHPYWDQDVAVVGGGNSAVEACLELFRVGARVTLVHFGTELDAGVKPWLLPDIRNRIEKGEIAVRWGHRVAEIRPESVILRPEEGGRVEVANDWLLALTGWTPDPSLLRALGVPVDDETGVPAHDPDTMETPIPGVFVAGVLAAGRDANRIFIENGRLHGNRILARILEIRGRAGPG